MERRLNIAFYAPLKSPAHPVPSGDRLMARLLMACLQAGGHQVHVVSELRAYLGAESDAKGWALLQTSARQERARLAALWTAAGVPDLWFCYHPYYKSPDLLGPDLSAMFGIPYISCEASYSHRRNIGIWADMQAQVLDAVRMAALNICMTERDRAGLTEALPDAATARLSPFILTEGFDADPAPEAGHLVCVAMMRPGDKFDSFVRLAATLARLPGDLVWRLSVAGDGPMRAEVQALFAGMPKARLAWLGKLSTPEVAALLATASVYVWPGCGEAYGLAYLEAQAAGVPVVAQAVAGVPEVVRDTDGGFLTPAGDDAAAASAIALLLEDAGLQRRMGQAARHRVRKLHGLAEAAERLNVLLDDAIRGRR